MKKCIKVSGLILLMMSLMMSTITSASEEIKVILNGEYILFDVQPQIINNRTMVPLRAIFEALGANVNWVNETQTAIATKDNVTVQASIGSTTMYINDNERIMDIPPTLVDGRTLVPVRFVAEAFDCIVDWDADTSTVLIGSITSSEYAVESDENEASGSSIDGE